MLSELHNRFRIRKSKTDPRRLAYLVLFLFASPSLIELSFGSVLAVLGIVLHGWAAGYLARAGNASRETELTLSGPYLHNRNPYYLAHMIMDFGFFLAAGLWPFYPVYLVFIFSVYRTNVQDEEQFLLEEFGADYRSYMEKVPRWSFRLSPASFAGRSEQFTWTDYFINSEHKRTGSHIIILILFWIILFYGNWLAHLPLLSRITIVLLMTTWLLLRDTRLQTKQAPFFQPIWLSAGLLICLLGAVALLTNNQFWTPIPIPYRYIFITFGGLLGLVGISRNISLIYNRLSSFFDNLLPVPNLNYLFLFCSIGFLTGTLGGLWIALLLSLFTWSIEASFGRPIPWPRTLLSF